MTAKIKQKDFLNGARLQRFESLQKCLVPRSKTFNRQQAQRSRDTVNHLLSQQSPTAQRKLAVFLVLFDIVTSLRYAKLFKNLSDDQQAQTLKFFFDSPIGLLRKGFWGLNTLARLGVYSQTELHQELGYQLRPDPAKEASL